MVTTSGMTFMNSPRMPGSKTSGRKAAIVVITEVVTGANTSLNESIMAAMASAPRCRR